MPSENWLPLSVKDHVHWELYNGNWSDCPHGTDGVVGFVFDGSNWRWAPSLSRLTGPHKPYRRHCVVEPMWVNRRRLDAGGFRKEDLEYVGDGDAKVGGLLVPYLDRLEYTPFEDKPFTADMAAWVDDHMRHLWAVADGIEALGKVYDEEHPELRRLPGRRRPAKTDQD